MPASATEWTLPLPLHASSKSPIAALVVCFMPKVSESRLVVGPAPPTCFCFAASCSTCAGPVCSNRSKQHVPRRLVTIVDGEASLMLNGNAHACWPPKARRWPTKPWCARVPRTTLAAGGMARRQRRRFRPRHARDAQSRRASACAPWPHTRGLLAARLCSSSAPWARGPASGLADPPNRCTSPSRAALVVMAVGDETWACSPKSGNVTDDRTRA